MDKQNQEQLKKHYALELLKTVLNIPCPCQKEIDQIIASIIRRNCNLYHLTNSQKYCRKALILSDNKLEQNVLAIMLISKNFHIEQVYTLEDLESSIFSHHEKHFDFVFISDYFKGGLNFLSRYFATQPKTCQVYVGNTPGIYAGTFRFDYHLEHPFFLNDLDFMNNQC